MGNGPFPDNGIIETQVGINLLAVPQNTDIQHHPVLGFKVPIFQLPQALQLTGLQFCYKPKAAHVDAQHRNLVQGHQLGEMQDGAVPAEGNQ